MTRLLQWSLLALTIVSHVLSKPLTVKPAPCNSPPLVFVDHHHRTNIDNSYIVLLKDDLSTDVKDYHMNFLLSALADDPFVGDELAGLKHIYDGHIIGYSGRFPERLIEQIRRMPEVKFVEKDQIVHVQEVQPSAPWVKLIFLPSNIRSILAETACASIGSRSYQSSPDDFRHLLGIRI